MGDAAARVGKYAFIATIEAPNPTFASMARTADNNHTGDVEGRKRKRLAAEAPKKAKVSNNRFLSRAGIPRKSECCGHIGWMSRRAHDDQRFLP